MFFVKNHSHESFERKEKLVVGSDKKFGYTFALFFFLMSVSHWLIPFNVRLILIFFSVLFTAYSLLEPSKLHRLNRLWMQFGHLLGQIVSPLILAVLFYLVFLPVGLILRFIKKDILNLTLKPKERSYWIDSSLLPKASMKDQF